MQGGEGDWKSFGFSGARKPWKGAGLCGDPRAMSSPNDPVRPKRTSSAITVLLEDSLVAQMVKNLPAMQEPWVQPLGWEDPPEEGMATTPVFLPENPRGQRGPAVYSPRARKESDATERLSPAQCRTMLYIFTAYVYVRCPL